MVSLSDRKQLNAYIVEHWTYQAAKPVLDYIDGLEADGLGLAEDYNILALQYEDLLTKTILLREALQSYADENGLKYCEISGRLEVKTYDFGQRARQALAEIDEAVATTGKNVEA